MLIIGLTIILFYNIFSIFILLFSSKINSSLFKYFDNLPYKYTIYFQSPMQYHARILQANNNKSKIFFNILKTTENKSALDYAYWNYKLLYQINQKNDLGNFEKNFQNAVILSKNNLRLKKSLKLFYLRNINQFNSETKNLILSN